jgi:hypothetical protein
MDPDGVGDAVRVGLGVIHLLWDTDPVPVSDPVPVPVALPVPVPVLLPVCVGVWLAV